MVSTQHQESGMRRAQGRAANLLHPAAFVTARRRFITLGAGLAAGLLAAAHSQLRMAAPKPTVRAQALLSGRDYDTRAGYGSHSLAMPAPVPAARKPYLPPSVDHHPDNRVLDQLARTPSRLARPPDVVLTPAQRLVFDSALARLRRLQDYVGYGSFNVISWDQSLRLARGRGPVGAFSRAELNLIEELFFIDAKSLGFHGYKVVSKLSANIPERDIRKIPGSGHFLFRDTSADTYEKIRRDLGDSVILTSGIRSVVKQIYLFMNKAEQVDGNLSLASYSLAPPGHSYHAVGDFDVGKRGWGHRNFSEAFAHTDEFRRLIDLGHLDIRYPQQNRFGVRYEPWHIKIV